MKNSIIYDIDIKLDNSRIIKYNFVCIYDFFSKWIKKKLNLNDKDKVECAYLCVKKIIPFINNEDLKLKSEQLLILIKRWLKDSKNIDNLFKINKYSKLYYNLYNQSLIISWAGIATCRSILHICNFILEDYSRYRDEYIVDSISFSSYLGKDFSYAKDILIVYARKIKQFNTKEHHNTYYENILKQIINIEYNELQDIDKNQAKDIINEYYDIEIDCFDFLTYKTIQREFM